MSRAPECRRIPHRLAECDRKMPLLWAMTLFLLVLPCGAFLASQSSMILSSSSSPFRRRHLLDRRRRHVCSDSSRRRERDLDQSLSTDLANTTSNITAVGAGEGSRAITLQQQARALRDEVLSLERALNQTKAEREEKLRREVEMVDDWIERLFVCRTVDENTQLLNDVDRVAELLRDGRYSQEHVNKIFDRICETNPGQSRSRCSELMSLLVDAAAKLDGLERKDNPNKRWSGRVERVLRKRLFAKDWGIELDEDGKADDGQGD